MRINEILISNDQLEMSQEEQKEDLELIS